MKRPIILLSILVLGVILVGCIVRHDERLIRIAETVAEYPEAAVTSLGEIPDSTLSSADRHYRDFLTIKANDKAYNTHESDKPIHDVIDYYSRHDRENLYPEALYYGGRVYSDLGDYPTALRYFQNALAALPDKPENRNLRANVLSQTGRLLGNLRLYEEATPYMEELLVINRLLKDTVKEVYDLQLLGSIYRDNGRLETAEYICREALAKSKTLAPSLYAKSAMNMAAVKLRKGEIDSALYFIRNTPETVSPMTRNTALAIASEIYQKAGVLDTAYHYAQQLIQSPDILNKKWGYKMLLSSDFRPMANADSIDCYASALLELIEETLDDHTNQLAITQEAAYNYQLHERERMKAEKSRSALIRWLIIAAFLILISSIGALYYSNRHKRNLLRLHEALENIRRLKEQLASVQVNSTSSYSPDDTTSEHCDDVTAPSSVVLHKPTEEQLQAQLREEVMELVRKHDHVPVSDIILQSPIYRELHGMAMADKCIPDSDDRWNELEHIVLQASPNFITNLTILLQGKLTTVDRQTALLIKCGFRPKEIQTLCSISNGALVSRRANLGRKICGMPMEAKFVNKLILLL